MPYSKPPPRYTPIKMQTQPPRAIVGADGIKRIIVYSTGGEVVSKRVIDGLAVQKSSAPGRNAFNRMSNVLCPDRVAGT